MNTYRVTDNTNVLTKHWAFPTQCRGFTLSVPTLLLLWAGTLSQSKNEMKLTFCSGFFADGKILNDDIVL